MSDFTYAILAMLMNCSRFLRLALKRQKNVTKLPLTREKHRVIIGNRFGLKVPSMVMLEQLKTVNQSDLIEYIGKIDDEHYMKKINIGIKKAMGLWVDKPYRKPTDIRCLCVKCLEDYKNNPNFIVKRLDPFARVKEKCDKCQNLGYDYLVIERSKEGR